ncbi:NUDIX hydrolase [Halobacterium bonnevillei]|uniref:Isopentenyl-diphosphate Delta-isomerase n=1 Tax=Halobacterium bonnevillei TaxID=2692200 RepID=A0A6B0SH38_9EURY|nr:NUDIX domain-containing protein [Halobacterium bonnevillei]MXR20938.1 NUDIX domain-containing protein [Halobacterium bonnevillei]
MSESGSDAPVQSTRDDETAENAEQDVVAVDAYDEKEGLANRLDAHTGDGVRHRAFTCVLFDQDGNVMLAQRAARKRLWDTHWDGTVASHPVEGQTQKEATRERLEEELGITADQYDDLEVTDRFEYKRYYLDEGLEWEVCAVLQATLTDTSFDRDPDEVGGVLWADYEDIYENPRHYRQLRLCPWFEIAMRRDFEGDADPVPDGTRE